MKRILLTLILLPVMLIGFIFAMLWLGLQVGWDFANYHSISVIDR